MDRTYSTRLQKGGALIEEMRSLVVAWPGAPDLQHLQIAGVPSRHRLHDVIARAFVPRFVDSHPPCLWKLAAVLERGHVNRSIIVPIHYYAAACSEPLMWDFTIDVLYALAGTGQLVSTDDVLLYIARQADEMFPNGRWTETVSNKVARGLLAALRDFGILEGASKKRMAVLYLPTPAFALLARIRHELGFRGESLISDNVWKLFLLTESGVRRFLAEAHAERLLSFEAAGPITRIDFPSGSMEDYAESISRRPAA